VTEVAVVIGNHQGERLLEDCLESLDCQTLRPAEVLVVDGASTDGSRAVAELRGASWIERPNLGLGHLYNHGVARASAPYVLLSNNDVAYDARCIELLAAVLDEDESLFASDPRQVDWDSGRLVHGRTTLSRGSLLREYLPGLHLDHTVEARRPMVTVSAHGAAMLVRRGRFLELGGFDETFFMEWEDLDLCWRAWLRGWGSVYVPEACLRHRVGAATTRSVLPKRLASSHHNLIRFALKCLPWSAGGRLVLGELLRLPRHPRLIAPALVAVARELPDILRERRAIEPDRTLFAWMIQGQPT
jgi:GT2 family glycosyltransferase